MSKNSKNKGREEKRGISRKFKEMGSELKKVTWPSFSTALKNTGIVLLVVAVFLVIIFIFDTILRFGVFNFLHWNPDSANSVVSLISSNPLFYFLRNAFYRF